MILVGGGVLNIIPTISMILDVKNPVIGGRIRFELDVLTIFVSLIVKSLAELVD